jgi:predicted transcriptional regulator
MTMDVLSAIERAQTRGYVPVPLEAIGDELTWRGSLSELEEQLDQLVAEARIKRRQIRSRAPEYWLMSIGGAA